MVLDSHQFDDNRISKHISSLDGKYEVFRLNFNFFPGRPTPSNTDDAVVIDLIPTKNSYLNGSLFTLNILIGRYVSGLGSLLKAKFLAKNDQVIFHVHDPYLLGLAVKLAKRFPDSRIVYDRHEYYESWKNRLGFSAPGLFERFYGRSVSEVVFVSRDHGHFPKSLSGKKVSVIPNYPWSGQFNREVVEKKVRGMDDGGDICVVYFGVLNLNFDRDVRLMFEVMRSIMQTNPNLRFVVAGRVYDEEVRSIIDAMVASFGERMSYLGEIPYKEVIERTQRSHLGFFLLRPDSHMWSEERPVSPNKIYEYLLSGTIPVIRATLDDREIIEKCSLAFGKDSTFKQVRDGILKLIGDRERMKRMILECYDAGQEFSWEKVAPRYLECYERVFGSMDQGNQ